MSDTTADVPANRSESEPLFPVDTKKSLGRLLVQMGRISSTDVERILEKQAKTDSSFGEAAVSLGLVTQRDIVEALNLQYQYPTLNNTAMPGPMARELVVGHDPFGRAAEEIRGIRTALLHDYVSEGLRSLAVIGVNRGAGATYFAANLALAMAQMTLPTILVDANMRHSSLAPMMNVPKRSRGLSEILRHREMDPSAIISDVMPNLAVLPCGAEPPNPQELLCSSEFASLSQWLETRYRVVIYDTPSAKEYADCRVVGARVGSAIVVARKHKTKYRDVSETVERLENIGCGVAGTIFNRH